MPMYFFITENKLLFVSSIFNQSQITHCQYRLQLHEVQKAYIHRDDVNKISGWDIPVIKIF